METAKWTSGCLRQETRVKSNYDLIVIGGGPAGLAAALGALEKGVRDILISRA